MNSPFGGRPVLLGHRGAPRQAPENTLESFAKALGAGLDGLELDLQRTRDGRLFVIHDPVLRGEVIAGLDAAELREREPDAPRIEEVLELLEDHPDAFLNLELKAPMPKRDPREADLVEILKEWRGRAKRRSWISSFDPISLLRLRTLGVPVPLALLAAGEEALDLVPCLPVGGVHVKHTLVTEASMASWRDRDLFVFAWTVNERADADRTLRLGVDGLIGDVPDMLLAARAEAGA